LNFFINICEVRKRKEKVKKEEESRKERRRKERKKERKKKKKKVRNRFLKTITHLSLLLMVFLSNDDIIPRNDYLI
jgi:uncharacterized ion transporter superfamily protein YfcC